MAPPRSAGFARYAWTVLGANLLVILWGAFVRASGSGAGCGSHWPLCNGEVVPRSPALATWIEFGHRVTSGAVLVLVAGLVVGAWRRFPRGSAVRRGAALGGLLLLSEAAIGAGLVLLRHVADDASLARGFWVSLHLVNTNLLIAALALTAAWASGLALPAADLRRDRLAWLALALAAALLLGVSGAVTALGDTLFPAASWSAGEAETFSETAHIFLRLRVWHPVLALLAAAAAAVAAWKAAPAGPLSRRLAVALVALYGAQLALGLANARLLAPIPLQIAHLLLADVIWLALVLLAAAALGEGEEGLLAA